MAIDTFRGVGWAFPVAIGADGTIKTAAGGEAINRSIELVLGTARGERQMRPDFGCDLHTFLFKPLNDINKGRMATAVKQALTTWEPRIRVLGVEITVDRADPATALIDIEYELRASNTRTNLVYPFYLQGVAP